MIKRNLDTPFKLADQILGLLPYIVLKKPDNHGLVGPFPQLWPFFSSFLNPIVEEDQHEPNKNHRYNETGGGVLANE